jgi:hypothetical protein
MRMSNRKLGILAVVAAVMVAWAVLQSHLSRHSRVEPSGPTYLIQGLDTTAIGSIVVGQGDKAVKIARKNGRFVVVNKADYPADPKQINDLISKCLDIKRSSLYTSNPKNHEDLEVTEEKGRSVVKLLKSDGTLLTGVIIGKSEENGQGAYVRMISSDDVYLTDSAPWFRTTPIEYVKAELLALKREDVNSVTVTTPEGAYTLRPQKDGDGVLMVDLPADKTLKTSDARSVLTALTSLRFEDVNTPSAVGELSFDHQYVCRLNDSTEYTLRLAKKDGKTYLRCEAAHPDMAQEHVLKFTLQHRGWVYEVPDWKANYLTKKRADLLEDKPKEMQEEPAETGATAPTAAPTPVTPTEGTSQPAAGINPNSQTATEAGPPETVELPRAVPEPNQVTDANSPQATQ